MAMMEAMPVIKSGLLDCLEVKLPKACFHFGVVFQKKPEEGFEFFFFLMETENHFV